MTDFFETLPSSLSCRVHRKKRIFHTSALRGCYLAPIFNNKVSKSKPVLSWNKVHEVLLNLFGVRRVGQIKRNSKPSHVGIHRNAIKYPVRISKHHVCGLARHTRQFQYCFHRVWYHSAKDFFHHTRSSKDVFCF